MRVVGFDFYGNTQELPTPVSAKIVSDYYGTASFSCSLPIEKESYNFSEVKVYDGNTLLFYGPLDKQSFSVGDDGSLLTLIARDFSALLLDNEALPQLYTTCYLSDLYNSSVKGYGIGYGFESNPYYYDFKVNKGYSEFETIERFCRFVGVSRPYVDVDKRIKLRSLSGNIRFSKYDQDIFSVQKIYNRYKPITDINLMQRDTMAYSLRVYNRSGLSNELSRRRFKKLFNYSDEDMKKEAGRIMAISRAGSREYKISIAGIYLARIGSGATLDYGGIKQTGLRVIKTEQSVSDKGEQTVVTLWPSADLY